MNWATNNQGRNHPRSVAVTRAALIGLAETIVQVAAGILIIGGGIAMFLVFG